MRSGRKMLLRDMVQDGYYPNLIVDPAWAEEPHPQEHLPPLMDAQQLFRPAPENYPAPSAPVLEASAPSLSWSESLAPASMIESYRLYRATGGGDFELIETLTVERDAFGAISNSPYSYEDTEADFNTLSYRYYVVAVPYQGPSVRSNTVQIDPP